MYSDKLNTLPHSRLPTIPINCNTGPTNPINPHASLLTLLTSTTIAYLYWFWIELCYSRNGFYPYPIFALLSTTQRVALFAGSGVAMWAIGIGLRWTYRTVNGVEGVRVRGKKVQ
jgi:hypothetical protein